MYEHNDTTRLPERGAIEISDFVYAATGARLRRLTAPDGEHWFARIRAPVAKRQSPKSHSEDAASGSSRTRTRPRRPGGDVGGISYPHE